PLRLLLLRHGALLFGRGPIHPRSHSRASRARCAPSGNNGPPPARPRRSCPGVETACPNARAQRVVKRHARRLDRAARALLSSAAMIFLHEIHEVVAGRMDAFEELIRTVWRPWVEERGEARLCWLWDHTHGTGPSYQAVSVTAVRDWATWGAMVDRARASGWTTDWQGRAGALRRDVLQKLPPPTAWSPPPAVGLRAPPSPP